jgi:uncharacterized protein
VWRLDGKLPLDRDDWGEALGLRGFERDFGGVASEPGEPLRALNEEIGFDGDWRRVNLVLKSGADPNAPDANGYRPLMIASTGYRPDLVRLLLRYGADPNLPSRFGITPLTEAACIGDAATLNRLPRAHAQVDARDVDGDTALHRAASPMGRECPEVLQILIAHGAGVNAVDKDGMTPLHWAARCGAEQAGAVLLDHGADPAVRSLVGRTPLDEAKRERGHRLVSLLEAAMRARMSRMKE